MFAEKATNFHINIVYLKTNKVYYPIIVVAKGIELIDGESVANINYKGTKCTKCI